MEARLLLHLLSTLGADRVSSIALYSVADAVPSVGRRLRTLADECFYRPLDSERRRRLLDDWTLWLVARYVTCRHYVGEDAYRVERRDAAWNDAWRHHTYDDYHYSAWTLCELTHRCGAMPATINVDGEIGWFVLGRCHSSYDDSPAYVFANGTKMWFRNGKHHRDADKPATEYPGGVAYQWWRDGALHRDNDQPAVMHLFGAKEWWRNGQRHRDGDQPAVVWNDGSKYWYRDGEYHRDGDMPAVESCTGERLWYRNGRPHRDVGPAVENADGSKEWYHDGVFTWRKPAPRRR